MPVTQCSLTEVLGVTPVSLDLIAASQLLNPLAIMLMQNQPSCKRAAQSLLESSQPAAGWQRLNWAAPACLQEVSTDPEKLGPRAADVGGKKMLQLLNDVSGAFRPGILTALVGSSGAGKTTLMDVLAGRKTSESPMQSAAGSWCGMGQTEDSAAGGWASSLQHAYQHVFRGNENGARLVWTNLVGSWVSVTCEGYLG